MTRSKAGKGGQSPQPNSGKKAPQAPRPAAQKRPSSIYSKYISFALSIWFCFLEKRKNAKLSSQMSEHSSPSVDVDEDLEFHFNENALNDAINQKWAPLTPRHKPLLPHIRLLRSLAQFAASTTTKWLDTYSILHRRRNE